MSEVLYARGKGKKELIITAERIECGDLAIATRAVTSMEMKSNMLRIVLWMCTLLVFGLIALSTGAKLFGYGVLAFAAFSAVSLPISFAAKVVVGADGRQHQLADGSRSEMTEVKAAVARALTSVK